LQQHARSKSRINGSNANKEIPESLRCRRVVSAGLRSADNRDLFRTMSGDTGLASTPSDIIRAQGDDQLSCPAMNLGFPLQVLWKPASACLDHRF